MRKVRFTGISRVGTLRPRRMWSPGEVLEVEDDVSEELNRLPGFKMLRRSPRKKEKVQKSETVEEPEKVEETKAEKPEEKEE